MKNKTVAGLLAIFLAGFGIHSFYLGQTGKGIVYLLVTGFTIFASLFIPLFFVITIVVALVSFITGIMLLCESEESFNLKYNQGCYSRQQRPLAPQQQWQSAVPQSSAPHPKETKTGNSKADMLMELKELLDNGVLTKEEFDAEKQKILKS